MKFRLANVDDKLKDVFLVYGMEISKKLLLPGHLEDFVFYLDGKRYIGGDFDFINGISELMAFTFDNEWFISAITKFLNEYDVNGIIPKPKINKTQIMIVYVVKDEETNNNVKTSN